MSARAARLAGARILMTTDAVGGVWQYACDLAAQLAAGDCEVTLALLGPAPGKALRAELPAGVRLIETGLPLDWLCDGPGEVQRAARELAGLAAETGADLVHCNSPALAGAAAFPVPVVTVAHGCIATWWQGARGGPLDPALGWHAERVRRGLTGSAATVAPSAAFAAMLAATYRLPCSPVVVHNGRPPAPATAGEVHRFHAALSVGRMWDPAKNAAVLDAAAAQCGVRLLAAGPLRGPRGEQARFAHAVALGTLPGACLAELLQLRPVFVSAATFEPFGLAVLEAASAGCALVLSDIPTFRELWDGAALFVPAQDAAGFAATIDRVHRDPELRWRLGEAAHGRAQRFTPAAMARGMAAIYAPLLKTRAVAA